MSTTSTLRLPVRPARREPPPRHGDEALLELVAAVAREAARRGATRSPEAVSVRAFNELRAGVDRARGVDPEGQDRIPTAHAVIGHFKARAVRPFSWADIVVAALAPAGKRQQGLVSTRRSDHATWLTDAHIAFALRRVASELKADTASAREYDAVSSRLREADKALNGEHAVLAGLLPTLDQVRHYCGDWKTTLAIAGLRIPTQSARQSARRAASTPVATGMPVATAVAYYVAVNGVWPSYPTMRAFARCTGFAMAARPSGTWTAVIDGARALLDDAGVRPPDGNGPKPLGKGKRLRFRYPVDGIPGAPAPGCGSPRKDADHERLTREFQVISVRVWLASRPAKQGRAAYVAWRTDDQWASPTRMPFAEVKREAIEANRRDGHAHGTDVSQAVLDRAAELRQLLATHRGRARPLPPFAETVTVVLAGPLGDVVAPKQA